MLSYQTTRVNNCEGDLGKIGHFLTFAVAAHSLESGPIALRIRRPSDWAVRFLLEAEYLAPGET